MTEEKLPTTITAFIKTPVNQAKLMSMCDNRESDVQKAKVGFLGELRKNPDLEKECSPESLFEVLIDSISLNLPIGANNYAYITSYYNKKTGSKEAKLHIGYIGYIKLFKEIYPDSDIDTKLIYAGDTYTAKLDPETGLYSVGYEKKSRFKTGADGLEGGYCLIRYNDKQGNPHTIFEEVPASEIIQARKASQTDMVWGKWFGEMAKKVIIRRTMKNLGLAKIEKVNGYDNENYDMENVTPPKPKVDYNKLKPLDPGSETALVIDAEVEEKEEDVTQPELDPETQQKVDAIFG